MRGNAHAVVTATAFEPLSIGEMAQRILFIRGQRVVLDTDLAAFYGETTKRFNQQISRNRARFPEDFMFQLSDEEFAAQRLQSATLKTGRGQHRKYLPYAFTEHGAIILETAVTQAPRASVAGSAVRFGRRCAGRCRPAAPASGRVWATAPQLP
jgi:hypothetical protein